MYNFLLNKTYKLVGPINEEFGWGEAGHSSKESIWGVVGSSTELLPIFSFRASYKLCTASLCYKIFFVNF